VYGRTPVVIAIIAANACMFLYQLSLGNLLPGFLDTWGIVPDTLSRSLYPLLTSMFLHGGWIHLLSNCAFLWCFGRNLEDRIGSHSFLAFYIACGLAAALLHVAMNPYSRVPTIGASGAIAGVMGAYLVKFWRTDVDALFWLIFVWRMSIPAPFYLIYWFALEFFSGLGSIGEVDYTGGGVARFAHVGGFVAGFLLIRIFKEEPAAPVPWHERE
jgi:membrane associated rhomboid family serine protease